MFFFLSRSTAIFSFICCICTFELELHLSCNCTCDQKDTFSVPHKVWKGTVCQMPTFCQLTKKSPSSCPATVDLIICVIQLFFWEIQLIIVLGSTGVTFWQDQLFQGCCWNLLCCGPSRQSQNSESAEKFWLFFIWNSDSVGTFWLFLIRKSKSAETFWLFIIPNSEYAGTFWLL